MALKGVKQRGGGVALKGVKQRGGSGALKGVKKGDRVAIYMPMITELVVAMLACARLDD